MIKVSDYIAKTLEAKRVGCVYELIGGMITHLIDSIHTQTKLKLVSVHHEQGAAFAADAMGRMTGIPGVAMATSGPGATNLVTGIADAYLDSTPLVAITGQVPQAMIGKGAFQETDVFSVTAQIVKHNYLVTDIRDLPRIVKEAFYIAQTGRPDCAM